jgi:hypothetical protein
MATGVTRLWITASTSEAIVKAIPFLLAAITVAAGAIIVLAFQQWVDFGITETRGIDAEAATGISDGWFVAALGSAILLLIGGVIFRPRLAPALLPMIALAAVCILAIAGFDSVTNWHASGFHPENPGILVQADGDPTIALYATAALATVIAISAAVVRAINLKQDPHLLGDLVKQEDEPDRADPASAD